jgi:hypothetical protein
VRKCRVPGRFGLPRRVTHTDEVSIPDPLVSEAAYRRWFRQGFDSRTWRLPEGFDPVRLGATIDDRRNSETDRARASVALQVACDVVYDELLNRGIDRLLQNDKAGPYGLVSYEGEISEESLTNDRVCWNELGRGFTGDLWREVERAHNEYRKPISVEHRDEVAEALVRAMRGSLTSHVMDLSVSMSSSELHRPALLTFALGMREIELEEAGVSSTLTKTLEACAPRELAARVATSLGLAGGPLRLLVETSVAVPRLWSDSPVRQRIEHAHMLYWQLVSANTGWMSTSVGGKRLESALRSDREGNYVNLGVTGSGIELPNGEPKLTFVDNMGDTITSGFARDVQQAFSGRKTKVHPGCLANRPSKRNDNPRNIPLRRIFLHGVRVLVAEGYYGDLSKIPAGERAAFAEPLVGADALRRETAFTAALSARSRSSSNDVPR